MTYEEILPWVLCLLAVVVIVANILIARGYVRAMKKLALYNHGKDSRPWGDKTVAFTEVAKRHGYAVGAHDRNASTAWQNASPRALKFGY